jgi:acyl-CoA synthetase (AMP-forming)/AMP-acid ligase II
VPSANADRIDDIVACVTSDRRGTTEELKQFLLRKLPAWQVPREWWFVKSLGTNARGKVSRVQWRKEFLEHRVNGVTRPNGYSPAQSTKSASHRRAVAKAPLG